jgi:hypothetical protein
MDETSLQLRHQRQIRNAFRIAGPALAGVGLLFILIGTADFFMAAGFDPPRFFWCNFVGMPLLFVGLALSGFGYMGVVQRYVAGESAPVAKDTFNYVGANIQPGVKSIASAVAQAVRESSKDEVSQRADT